LEFEKMLTFLSVFAAGVAVLLGAQQLDIECVQPRKPAKIARAKQARQADFKGAVTQS